MRQLSQRGERQGLRQGCARRGELLKYPGLPGALQSCTDTGLHVEMVELLLLFFFSLAKTAPLAGGAVRRQPVVGASAPSAAKILRI